MKKLLVLGVILLFSALAFAGSADASHEKYTFRYITGNATGGGVLPGACFAKVDDVSFSTGGSCTRPCPHGTCDITVIDDRYGDNAFYRILIDDEPFFRPQFYTGSISIEGDNVRVAVHIERATTGTITIE